MNLKRIGVLCPILIGLNSASAALITLNFEGTARVNGPSMDNTGALMPAEFRQEFGFGDGDAISLSLTYDDAIEATSVSPAFVVRDDNGNPVGSIIFVTHEAIIEGVSLDFGALQFSSRINLSHSIFGRVNDFFDGSESTTSFEWFLNNPFQSSDPSVTIEDFSFLLNGSDSALSLRDLSPLTGALLTDGITIEGAPTLTSFVLNNPDNGSVGLVDFQVNSFSVVPEPSTGIFLGLAALGFVGLRKRV